MFRKISTKILYTVGGIVQVGCVIHVFAEYVAEPTLCIGPSMQPTINGDSPNNIVLTEHISSRLQLIDKNDIVIAHSPSDPTTTICKRITTTEGEIVRVNKKEYGEKTVRVPKGHVWLTGDNLENSVDSRTYGPVPSGLIIGRVCFKVLNIQ